LKNGNNERNAKKSEIVSYIENQWDDLMGAFRQAKEKIKTHSLISGIAGHLLPLQGDISNKWGNGVDLSRT